MKPEDMDKIAEAIAMTLKEEGSQEKAKAIVKEPGDIVFCGNAMNADKMSV